MSASGKHVIVSGGGRGLGQTIVADLLQRGYRVSTFSRSGRLDREPMPAGLYFAAADLTSEASLRQFLQGAQDAHGAPWGLVNNAAIALEGLFVTQPWDDVRSLFETNVLGTMLLTRLVARTMLTTRSGRIVNISSIVGLRGYRGLAVYGATKAALDGFTRALARELGEVGITVNSIAPGFLATEMTGTLSEAQKEQIVRRTPIRRLGVPADCTGAIAYLLGDESSYVTGQTIVLDGGVTI